MYYSDWDIHEEMNPVPQAWYHMYNGTNVPYETVDINTETRERLLVGDLFEVGVGWIR